MNIILILSFLLAIGIPVECQGSGHQKIKSAVKKSRAHNRHQIQIDVLRGGSATTNQISTKKAAAIGCLLALNSGMVNGACLSGILHETKQVSFVEECLMVDGWIPLRTHYFHIT